MATPEQRLKDALENARARLASEMRPEGCWSGRLSSSALSTAIGVFGLHCADSAAHREDIASGVEWLVANVNADGGWGDTTDSPSNLATTLLCWSSLSAVEAGGEWKTRAIRRAEEWIAERIGDLDPATLAGAVTGHYGKDRTFAAPILTMCALAGRLGQGSGAWRLVPQLPFELAALPHRLFRWLRLPVVSYALPALIAIGLVRHRNGSGRVSLGLVRRLATASAMRKLTSVQPSNGGFLEATPLTGFVVMSLCGAGFRGHEVTRKGVRFLAASKRADGSWPIDTNLSTWVTTLSTNALVPTGGEPQETQHVPDPAGTRDWLLEQQFRETHSFTGARPGGWSWTNLPGAVPDADDTSGALLALRRLGVPDAVTREAASRGIDWLLRLQNRDGGIPTFCRGWTNLPFDRSCPDITAHALRAFAVWRGEMTLRLRRRVNRSIAAGLRYLAASQNPGGSWVPLWFGNQNVGGHENPVYGTAQVVAALADLPAGPWGEPAELMHSGADWLVAAQGPDGGWGGDKGAPPSVEETALAVRALARVRSTAAVRRGVAWLLEATAGGARFEPSPIGLYFASLWYSEKLYPLIFTVDALGAAQRALPDR